MENMIQNNRAKTRLEALELESESIITSYLQQVAIDANSLTLKTLQNKLREVRQNQWKMYGLLDGSSWQSGDINMAA